jgi:hypothetical protein
MTTGTIDPRFGVPSATAPAWADVERLLVDAEPCWLTTTVRADGRPLATVNTVGRDSHSQTTYHPGCGAEDPRSSGTS